MDGSGGGGAYMINKHMYRYIKGQYGKDEEAYASHPPCLL